MPVDRVALRAMKPYMARDFYNPSALYAGAVRVREAVESARKTAAGALFTQPDTIIFTSGGTESINLAILGVVRRQQAVGSKRKWHIITSAVEHHAVLDTVKQLEREGCAVTYLPVDREGLIGIEDFKKALRPETVLVSIMYANNEIGTIQPLSEIGREILKWRKRNGLRTSVFPYFHTDACQAAAYLELNVEKLHVDLMSLNGSKIYGPKGSGILYKRRGVEIEPLMYGGGQELGARSGTENVAGIVGFAKALELVQADREKEWGRVERLRDYFWAELERKVTKTTLNGPAIFNEFRLRTQFVTPKKFKIKNSKSKINRLPNNLNITFTGADAEAMIIYLDVAGIQCSSGSACTEATDEVSHVLLACGLDEDGARSSLRFTLGKSTTKKDIDYVLKALPGIVEKCRIMNSVN